MFKFCTVLFVLSLLSFRSFSQNVLPDFSLKKGVQNQKVVSWKNNFGDMIVVLTIQRSDDSLRNFRTLYSAPNPNLQVNAYTDIHPVAGLDYYRIYYQLRNGTYFFTKAKKITSGFISDGLFNNISAQHVIIKGDEERTVSINDFHKIADSVLNNTSDSLFYFSDSTVNYKNLNPMPKLNSSEMQNLVPISSYMFQNPDGSVVIRLPDNKVYNYSMTIYQQDGNGILYKINHFDSPEIILTKSSFTHSGFYPYELFEDGKLKERSKFMIK